MGLDIYLYKSNDADAHRAWELAKNEAEESAPDWTGDGAAYKAHMASWEAEHPDPAPEESVKVDSKVHPDHMFKIGYLRSSYNDGGIERVVGNLTGKDLHWIFAVEGDEYVIRPDWGACLKRAVEARDALDASIREHGSYKVSASARNMFSPDGGPQSAEDALAIFRRERAEYLKRPKREGPFDFSSYSNRDGEFMFGEPLKVAAIIPGHRNILGSQSCAYVVFESDLSWYQQALQVTAEMCEWVLSQPDARNYYLHWSG